MKKYSVFALSLFTLLTSALAFADNYTVSPRDVEFKIGKEAEMFGGQHLVGLVYIYKKLVQSNRLSDAYDASYFLESRNQTLIEAISKKKKVTISGNTLFTYVSSEDDDVVVISRTDYDKLLKDLEDSKKSCSSDQGKK